MNRLSIVLVIAFVSYSLSAPETNETYSGDISHDLEHSSDQDLEKQNVYGDGNEDSDPSALEDPNTNYSGNKGRKPKPKPKPKPVEKPRNRPGSPGIGDGLCVATCAIVCASGLENTADCALCMNGCIRQ